MNTILASSILTALQVNQIHPTKVDSKFTFNLFFTKDDKKLEIPGENVANIFAGRQLVNWYNGHPEYTNLPLDFSLIKNVLIIGYTSSYFASKLECNIL